MGNTIIIGNRLIWIDWAKALAISFVIFGHIPMERRGRLRPDFYAELYYSIPHAIILFYIRLSNQKRILQQGYTQEILAYPYYPLFLL